MSERNLLTLDSIFESNSLSREDFARLADDKQASVTLMTLGHGLIQCQLFEQALQMVVVLGTRVAKKLNDEKAAEDLVRVTDGEVLGTLRNRLKTSPDLVEVLGWGPEELARLQKLTDDRNDFIHAKIMRDQDWTISTESRWNYLWANLALIAPLTEAWVWLKEVFYSLANQHGVVDDSFRQRFEEIRRAAGDQP